MQDHTGVLVRYRVAPGRAAENEELVRAVFAELDATRPADLRYASHTLQDGVTFVHLATSAGASPLPELGAFRAFQAGLRDRCDEPPAAEPLREVGRYAAGTAVDVALAYLRAWAADDRAAVRALLAPAATFEGPTARADGADAFAEAVGAFAPLVARVDVVSALGDDREALLLYDMVTGPYGTMRAAEHLTVAGGRITASRLVFDARPLAGG